MKRVPVGLFSKSAKSPTPAAFSPRLEGLGDRTVPAIVSIQQNLATGAATITANGANDTITFTDAGTGAISVNGTLLNAGIKKIELSTGGGSDTVVYNVTGNMARSIELKADLNTGSDSFTLNQNGFDVLAGVNEIMRVSGGAGGDTIRVVADGASGNRVNIASTASMQLDLSGGSNFDPFDAADTISVDYRGELDGKLRLKAEGGLGGDSLRALLTLDAGSSGQVTGFNGAKAVLAGDIGPDTIDFRVRNNGSATVSAEANAGLDLNQDTVRHTANVSSVFAFGDGDQVVN